MQPERRPLVVTAELEPSPPVDRLLAAVDVHLLDHPAQLAHPFEGRLYVVHPEEQVRRRPPVPTVHPTGNRPRPDREPLPGRTGLEPPAEQPFVERPRRQIGPNYMGCGQTCAATPGTRNNGDVRSVHHEEDPDLP